jgi:prephenate dehydratase
MPSSTPDNSKPLRRIAIQGERGSNSHMAALAMLGEMEIVPCSASPEVFAAVVSAIAEAAVLPIENSLHGSVAEHYDLLLQHPVRIAGESLLRIRHNLIAAPGVKLEQIRTVISHPVALSQCRDWLAKFPQAKAVPFYDTAGSVKHLMAERLRDTAGVAPALAAKVYGANVLVAGIEDHAQNLTRFHLIQREGDPSARGLRPARQDERGLRPGTSSRNAGARIRGPRRHWRRPHPHRVPPRSRSSLGVCLLRRAALHRRRHG